MSGKVVIIIIHGIIAADPDCCNSEKITLPSQLAVSGKSVVTDDQNGLEELLPCYEFMQIADSCFCLRVVKRLYGCLRHVVSLLMVDNERGE